MKGNTLSVVLVAGFVLAGCSSNPVTMTDSGEKYFSSNKASYSDVEVEVTSRNEQKAVQAGYMSNVSIKKYMTTKIKKDLEQQNIASDDGVTVDVNLVVWRIYSWGRSDSMSTLRYSGTVQVENDGFILARYPIGGDVEDSSILGNLKTIFAKNDASNESKYFDVVANSIVGELPR